MVESGKPTDVVAGWVTGTLGTATVNAYKFTSKSLPIGFSLDMNLTNTYGTEINGETTIFFTRPINAGSNPIRDSLSNLIGAYSLSNSDTFGYHGSAPSRSSSSAKLQANFFTGSTVVSKPLIELRDVHATILFITWGLILPFGMIWARYARKLADDIWFKVHRVFQYGGVLLSLIGIIIGYVMVGTDQFRVVGHSVLGTFILLFSVTQVIVAFFRPHKENVGVITKSRMLFELFHHWNGRFLVIMAIIQIYLGIYAIGYDQTHGWVIPFFTVVIVLAIVVVIFLEVAKKFKERRDEDKEGYELK
jgi:hypothetical protein